jgi:SAM-dependent methyltransferase
LRQNADAVYGSRFGQGEYRRVLYFRHTLGNRLITLLSNLMTDLNLSDVETGYKAVRTPLLKSIPIRSNDFRIEIELSFKLAKRDARIFEVPISYNGRSYEEGKKIGVKDGVLAFVAMARWWLIDDLYRPDQYGSNILAALSEVPRFNLWMASQLRSYVGSRVLEIGAGIGNLTRTLLPRDSYTASEINPLYLEQLRALGEFRPYMSVAEIDLGRADHFGSLEQQYDTVICLNVLEHVPDEAGALANIFGALSEGGRALILVPQHPWLFGSLDTALDHCRRYTRSTLEQALLAAGFSIERIFDFNRVSVPGWWLNGRVLQRRHISRFQLKILDSFLWFFRRIDRWLPWGGISLIAVARRPGPPA